MGINVVESEDEEGGEEDVEREIGEEEAESDKGNVTEHEAGRTDDPSACICAKWVRSSC